MFGYPGGAILPFYQTLPEYPQIRHILVRHEQGAGHAADGYSRATGKVGVAVATSGPGATNLATALATAMMDSSAMVAITGQVPRAMIGKDAFQETDVTGITLPITKHNYLVMDIKELPRVMKEAFFIARTGRPGPVLIDVPKDLQQETAEFEYPEEEVRPPGYRPVYEGDPAMVRKAVKYLEESQRPVILAGHGVITAEASRELREFAEKAQIPVITTLLGISSFPEDHVLSVGMPGMHGMAFANIALDHADLIIAVGARFDDRVTGKVSEFAPNAKIIHIDIDPAEMGKMVKPVVPIVGDVKPVLREFTKQIQPTQRVEWLRQVDQWRVEHPSHQIREEDKLLPQHVIRELSDATRSNSIIVTGVGQHQMWAAQHFKFLKPRTFITSGGLGTMGFEVPAAMGAKVGRPDMTVWSVAGDGGFQMTMYELATMVEYNIPVKYAIMNNQYLGMVRQWQEIFYQKSYVATHLFNPDFVKLAEAYGILGLRVTERSQMRGAIEQAMNHPGPVLVDFQVAQEENVYPMIPPGTSVKQMLEEPQPAIRFEDSKDASS